MTERGFSADFIKTENPSRPFCFCTVTVPTLCTIFPVHLNFITIRALTFWFPTKADILLEFTNKIMNYHEKFIEYTKSKGHENLYTYCLEIVVQTALCEERENIRDIYYSMYSHPLTMAFLKDWTAQKNLNILGPYLQDWDLIRFRRAANVTCCIERSALAEPCTEDYTLEDKIYLTLTCLLKIYDFEKSERERVINKILATDYHKIKAYMLTELDKFLT